MSYKLKRPGKLALLALAVIASPLIILVVFKLWYMASVIAVPPKINGTLGVMDHGNIIVAVIGALGTIIAAALGATHIWEQKD